MGRFSFTAIALLALTGCQGRGPLHVPGQDYAATPPSPVVAQPRLAMATTALPGATNEPGATLTNVVLHAGTSNDWGNIQMRASTLSPWQSVETNVMGGTRNIQWTNPQAQYRFEKMKERVPVNITITKGTAVMVSSNISGGYFYHAGMKPAVVSIHPQYQQP